jgi:hypothetical protein
MVLLADRVTRAQCGSTEPTSILGQPASNEQDSMLGEVLGTNIRSHAGICLKGQSKIMKTNNPDSLCLSKANRHHYC